MNPLLSALQGGLIVSCQALPGEPLCGPDFMVAMAMAALEGGAVGLRANGAVDIAAIKKATSLPLIGISKQLYPGSDVYITPTMAEVDVIVEAGADIVATDVTMLARPDGLTVPEFVQAIRKRHTTLIMGDVSTLAEGIAAMEAGVDLVSTTLSGYTPHSKHMVGPDFTLLEALVLTLQVPVVAEGRIATPEECERAFRLGAFATVIGSAITRPQEIVKRFAASTPRGVQVATQGL